nr:MAG TPA: hypothetical protein [Caudoviricetes sp.]
MLAIFTDTLTSHFSQISGSPFQTLYESHGRE